MLRLGLRQVWSAHLNGLEQHPFYRELVAAFVEAVLGRPADAYRTLARLVLLLVTRYRPDSWDPSPEF